MPTCHSAWHEEKQETEHTGWNFFSKGEVEPPRNMGRKTKTGLCISSLKSI